MLCSCVCTASEARTARTTAGMHMYDVRKLHATQRSGNDVQCSKSRLSRTLRRMRCYGIAAHYVVYKILHVPEHFKYSRVSSLYE